MPIKSKKINRAVSTDRLLKMKFKHFEFTGDWKASFGTPETNGAWIIWANSSNGKTRFSIQLAKYLTNFGNVLYNTLEEGARSSMQRAVRDENLKTVGSKFKILNREPIDDLIIRLHKPKSANVIFIDSFQHAGLNKKQYIELKELFPKKLFIFISHADGKQPEGRPAKFVRYDCDLKIRVVGFKALNMGRVGGGTPYTIWEKGAIEFHDKIK